MVFGLNLRRSRGARGATLLLTMLHPAQRDFDQSLAKLARASSPRVVVRSEGRLQGVDSAKIRAAATKASIAQRHLIVHSTLSPDARLVAVFDRSVAHVERLVEALGRRDVRIVVVWTPHDRLVEVTYVRQAENGATTPFPDHRRRALDANLSYAPFVRSLSAMPGVTNVSCYSWTLAEQRLSALLRPVLGAVTTKIPAVELAELDRPATVRGFASKQGVEVAQAMNRFTGDPEERVLVRSFVRHEFRARDLSDIVYLDADERRRLSERYAEDVATLQDLQEVGAG